MLAREAVPDALLWEMLAREVAAIGFDGPKPPAEADLGGSLWKMLAREAVPDGSPWEMLAREAVSDALFSGYTHSVYGCLRARTAT
jgi:hypothetical protein